MSIENKKVRIIEVDASELAREKQAARDADAAHLEAGLVSEIDLRRRNGFLHGFDFSKAKIVAVGDKKYDDLD